MIVLDCTLRDGGYYNNWEFSIDTANEYLKTIEASNIQAIEVGFRSNKKETGFKNATDDFIIDSLYIPNVDYFGVMVDNCQMSSNIIRNIFKYESESPINLVRSAVHFKDIDDAESVCKELKNLGYVVSCNLMQAADKGIDEIKRAAFKVSTWKAVDVLYLADSLGGMNHDIIDYAYKSIKEGWDGLTGFHGHNNKGQSLNNSLEAVDIGVDWIDGTILGMGRGPGNTETEYLLGELNKRGFGEFDVDVVYKLALNWFLPLKEKYGWGPSLPYYLSAEYNIHPIYVQKMLSGGVSMEIVLKALYFLRDKNSNSFDDVLLQEAIK